MVSQQSLFPEELLLPLRPKSHVDPGSLTTSMVDVLVNKLETLIASMLEMDVNKRPLDIACVKQELQEVSTLWSGICKSSWRPRLGYTQHWRGSLRETTGVSGDTPRQKEN